MIDETLGLPPHKEPMPSGQEADQNPVRIPGLECSHERTIGPNLETGIPKQDSNQVVDNTKSAVAQSGVNALKQAPLGAEMEAKVKALGNNAAYFREQLLKVRAAREDKGPQLHRSVSMPRLDEDNQGISTDLGVNQDVTKTSMSNV